MYVVVSMFVTCVQLVSAACGMSCRAVKHYTQQPTSNFAFSRQDLVISLDISDVTLVYAGTVSAQPVPHLACTSRTTCCIRIFL